MELIKSIEEAFQNEGLAPPSHLRILLQHFLETTRKERGRTSYLAYAFSPKVTESIAIDINPLHSLGLLTSLCIKTPKEELQQPARKKLPVLQLTQSTMPPRVQLSLT